MICEVEQTYVLAMDAVFSLPRKKSAGVSYRGPIHEKLFFCSQSPVDEFVNESYSMNKVTPTIQVRHGKICWRHGNDVLIITFFFLKNILFPNMHKLF